MFLQKLKVFFAVIHLLTTCYSLPLSQFYPYGVSKGDTALSPNDDGGSGKITLSTPFQYFDFIIVRFLWALIPFFEVKSIFLKPWTEILAYFWLLLNSRWNRVLCMYVCIGGKTLFLFFFLIFAKIYLFLSHKMWTDRVTVVIIYAELCSLSLMPKALRDVNICFFFWFSVHVITLIG